MRNDNTGEALAFGEFAEQTAQAVLDDGAFPAQHGGGEVSKSDAGVTRAAGGIGERVARANEFGPLGGEDAVLLEIERLGGEPDNGGEDGDADDRGGGAHTAGHCCAPSPVGGDSGPG